MFDLAALKKYDPSGMHEVYDNWPEHAKKSYELAKEEIDFGPIDHIIFAGMGGSGAIGDIFASILSKTNIHVCVVKGYLLPRTVDANTLVITTSISGNTLETLTILDSARKLGSKLIAFSSGGKMGEYCIKNNVEHRYIERLHSPRATFPTALYTMLKVLGPMLPIEKGDIDESINQLKTRSKSISSSYLNYQNPSLSLAKWLSDTILVYYPAGLNAAAMRFKNCIQENAKMHAMIENVIEACHNQIVSWERPSNVKPVMIEGVDDYIKTKERWNILKEYFRENKIDYREVVSSKGSILTKLIDLIYVLDYATIYCAIMSSVDPSPVRQIEFVKKRLS